MILRALVQLARDEGLVAHADFEHCAVRWLLSVGPSGELLGAPQDTLQTSTGGKGKATPRKFRVPKRLSRSAQNRPQFLVDKAEYVFGWPEPGKEGRQEGRHRLY